MDDVETRSMSVDDLGCCTEDDVENKPFIDDDNGDEDDNVDDRDWTIKIDRIQDCLLI